MEPGQYTGKTDATSNADAAGEPAQRAAVDRAAQPEAARAPAAPSRASPSAGPSSRRASGGNTMRVVAWTAVLALLGLGLTLYFRYERGVAPLFGPGR